MAVEIRGSFAVPALKLRRMVALSPAWQRAVETAPKKPEAPDGVWLRDVLGLEPRPFAVISLGQAHQQRLIAGGDRNYLRASGSLMLFLSCDTPPQFYEDQVQAEFFAGALFGQVVDDVVSLSAADDEGSEDGTSHLAITDASLVTFGETGEEDWESLGRFYFATYSFDWGDGGGGD